MGIGARLALVGDLVDGHSVLEQNPRVPPGHKFSRRRLQAKRRRFNWAAAANVVTGI
jgi:hypothetical protein